MGATLPSHLADLIDIAVAIHVGDRLAIRGVSPASEWRRSVSLTIPVRCPDLWNRLDVKGELMEVLGYLTEDDWQLHFCERPIGFSRAAESQRHLFLGPFDGPVHVSLFSGGLDSFAGTATAIARHPDANYVCVSGMANRLYGQRQRQQVQSLKALKRVSLTHVRVPCWLRRANEIRQEPTRRTRGFLFLALGAVTALAAGGDRLWIFENGVGALNLPFMGAEVGVTTTRAVHPKTLILMGKLLSLIAGREFSVWNGAVFETKAQMCSSPLVRPVLSSVPLTFSCDGFPLRRQGAAQCGVCTSCLLRRVALYNAGVPDQGANDYRYDVQSPGAVLNERQNRGLWEMDWQAERLSLALSQSDPWFGLVSAFPRIVEAQQALAEQFFLHESIIAERLVNLYRSHCDEWQRFPMSASRRISRKAA
jgi:hypothetical protein